ncbi:MAG: zeta toxin family protein [Campylobacter sp.]|nr:zeta toxin family protein [Campylobacter sp.]
MTEIEELAKFNEQDVDQVVNDFWDKKVIATLKSVKNPRLSIIGGQPGAGKSNTIKDVAGNFNQNCISVNYDDFRKDHPNAAKIYALDDKDSGLYSQFTNEFMGRVGDKILNRAFDNGYNVILEKTLKSDNVKEYIDLAINKGYDIDMHIVTCERSLSMEAAERRFQEAKIAYDQEGGVRSPPRKIPQKFHDLCCEKLGETTQKLSDTYGDKIKNLRIIRRDKFFEQDIVFDKSLGYDTTKIKETIDCLISGKERKLSDMEKAQISVMKRVSEIRPFKTGSDREKEIAKEKIDDGRSFED